MDNGAIRFTSVRLPRENLLDRFATGERALQGWPQGNDDVAWWQCSLCLGVVATHHPL